MTQNGFHRTSEALCRGYKRSPAHNHSSTALHRPLLCPAPYFFFFVRVFWKHGFIHYIMQSCCSYSL